MAQDEQIHPDQVFILRFWREDYHTWRVQVSDENKRILGWAEGVEQCFELLRSLLGAPEQA